MNDKLREDFEIATEQKPIKLSGQIPVNYAVGDIRYVEWLEDKLNNTCHEPKHETVEIVDALEGIIKAWDNLTGDRNYTPEIVQSWLRVDMKPSIDKCGEVIANHHGKPEEV